MKRFFLLAIHLLLVIAAVGCTSSTGSPTAGDSPVPSSPATTWATATASSSGVSAIPFQTLAQGFRLSSTQSKPTLLRVVDNASRDAMAALIDPRHQTLLKKVDLEREQVLAAFWGTKPSGGFSITISSIFITKTDLTVNVILRENDPTVPRGDVSTFPYHLVTVNRLTLPMDTTLHYRLVGGDGLLATGDLP